MWSESRPNSSWRKATWALLYYVVVPTAIITALMWRYPELNPEHFQAMLRSVLVMGTAIVAVNVLRGEHDTGTYPRLVLDVALVGLAIGWILVVLGGGTVLHQSWNGYEFVIDIRNLFLIIAALASLNLVYYVLRFAQERGLITKGGDAPPAEVDAGVPVEEAPTDDDGAVTIEYVDEGMAS